MSGLGQDLRWAIRLLGRSPLWTAAALVSLWLGIAANTVIFSLVNAVLLQPLPAADPDRLVRVGTTIRGQDFQVVSYPEYRDLEESIEAFEGLLAYRFNQAVVNTGGDPLQEGVEIASANYFSVLGVQPAMGRGFLPGEDRGTGTHPVAVISHSLWQRRMQEDPDALGRIIQVSGQPFTVVGVAPQGFRGTFPGFEVGLWVPLSMHDQVLARRGSVDERADRIVLMIGRLKPGATRQQAQVQLDTAAQRLASLYPDLNQERGFRLAEASGVHPNLAGIVQAFLALLMGAVGLVLLISCANVASLLLARASTRGREIALRLALGAGRIRLLRQLMTESLLLALLGGAGGLLLAIWACRLLSNLRPIDAVPLQVDLQVDPTVLLFALLISLLTGLLFGLAPAWRTSRPDLVSALKWKSGRGTGGGSKLRSALVMAQVAISALLLVGAGLLLQTLIYGSSLQAGFPADQMLVASADPASVGYSEVEAREYWQQLMQRASSLPQVESAALGLFVPLAGRSDRMQAEALGSLGQDAQAAALNYNFVGPGYFQTLQIPLTQGREFGTQDHSGSAPTAIVNQTLAKRFWPQQDPVGQSLRLTDRNGVHRVAQVVAVARDIRYRDLSEPPTPFIYLPQAQWYRSDLVLHLRVGGDPRALIPGLASLARSLEPELPVRILPMTDEMSYTLLVPRIAAGVMGFSGAAGLLLASIGLFGVVSHSVAQRRQEIGIRMALGAQHREVRRMVVGQALKITAGGLVAGLLAALGATRLLAGFLYGVTPTDPPTFMGIAFLLLVVSLAAAYQPIYRAMRVDPVEVLRYE